MSACPPTAARKRTLSDFREGPTTDVAFAELSSFLGTGPVQDHKLGYHLAELTAHVPESCRRFSEKDMRNRSRTEKRAMKFTWFNLMPWPYLPDDFREKNRSVWVDIDQKLFDPGEEPRGLQHLHGPAGIRRHPRVRRHRRERAPPERLRHHALPEHHRRGPGAPHQGRGHRRAGQLHRPLQSAGPRGRGVRHARLHLGRAAGGRLPGRHLDGHQLLLRPDPDPDAREVPGSPRPDHQGLDEREPFAFNGRYNKLRHVNIWPRPIQQPHPPVHIPGGGSVETYDFCIDNTYSYSYLSFSGYLRAQALMNGYWKRVEERDAPTSRPIAPASPRRSAWPTPTRRPSGSTPSTSTTSTTAACTSIRASPTRRATAPSRPSRPARCRNTPRRAAATPS